MSLMEKTRSFSLAVIPESAALQAVMHAFRTLHFIPVHRRFTV